MSNKPQSIELTLCNRDYIKPEKNIIAQISFCECGQSLDSISSVASFTCTNAVSA